MVNANEIQSEFISLLRQVGEKNGFRVELFVSQRRISNSIIQLSGSIDYVIYFKVRSKRPYRWGVTANRIDELEKSGKAWFLILLYETPSTGYLIPAADVNRYRSIWPLGSDGDYKVQPGKYLQFNSPFHSFSEFINSLLSDSRLGYS